MTSNEQNYPLHILDSHESLHHAIIRSNETDAQLTVKSNILENDMWKKDISSITKRALSSDG